VVKRDLGIALTGSQTPLDVPLGRRQQAAYLLNQVSNFDGEIMLSASARCSRDEVLP
jgi:hypothetical protein